MARYLDIDTILADEDRVPVKFVNGAYGLGHLDASSATKDIEEDQTLDLPLWIAKPMAAANSVHVELPKSFSSKARGVGAVCWVVA